MNPLLKFKNLRLSNVNRVIIGNLNINALTNKFNQLKEIVLEYIYILVITKTKLDNTFPNAQFLVPGFSKPFRLDINRKGGQSYDLRSRKYSKQAVNKTYSSE